MSTVTERITVTFGVRTFPVYVTLNDNGILLAYIDGNECAVTVKGDKIYAMYKDSSSSPVLCGEAKPVLTSLRYRLACAQAAEQYAGMTAHAAIIPDFASPELQSTKWFRISLRPDIRYRTHDGEIIREILVLSNDIGLCVEEVRDNHGIPLDITWETDNRPEEFLKLEDVTDTGFASEIESGIRNVEALIMIGKKSEDAQVSGCELGTPKGFSLTHCVCSTCGTVLDNCLGIAYCPGCSKIIKWDKVFV